MKAIPPKMAKRNTVWYAVMSCVTTGPGRSKTGILDLWKPWTIKRDDERECDFFFFPLPGWGPGAEARCKYPSDGHPTMRRAEQHHYWSSCGLWIHKYYMQWVKGLSLVKRATFVQHSKHVIFNKSKWMHDNTVSGTLTLREMAYQILYRRRKQSHKTSLTFALTVERAFLPK